MPQIGNHGGAEGAQLPVDSQLLEIGLSRAGFLGTNFEYRYHATR